MNWFLKLINRNTNVNKSLNNANITITKGVEINGVTGKETVVSIYKGYVITIVAGYSIAYLIESNGNTERIFINSSPSKVLKHIDSKC